VKITLTKLGAAVCFLVLSTGCGEHKQAKVGVPPPPPLSGPEVSDSTVSSPSENTQDRSREAGKPTDAKPIFVETGIASWYGPPYHNRRASNGEIYDMNAFTAAHRTLPLGSIVRVTNIKTGHSTVVRITDRGPFIEGRMLDLSLAAAKKVDVWLPGTARVRMEVLQTPSPLDRGGRWAVQIGAFEQENTADKLADHLSHRYHTAKVLCFSSPVGDWWVRVRVQADDRQRAEELARETKVSEAAVFLVRLD